MGAVVKLTVLFVRPNIRHASSQICGCDMVQAEFLKTRGIQKRRGLFCVYPVPSRGSSGVLAAVQGFRNDVGTGVGCRHQSVDQCAFAGARWAQHQGDPVVQFGAQCQQGVFKQTQTQRQDIHAKRSVGR